MTRLLNAWGALGRDQRWAALASLGLFVSMLLPWYSKTVVVRTRGGGAGTQSLNAFQAFSFVEAAVLLVSVGVLAMLFARAEQRDFQLPGGDGTIVMIAGAWVAILIFYRLFDKPGLQGNQQIVSEVGVQWGIFAALLIGLALAYCGRRVRLDERGAPPLSRTRRAEPDEPEPTRPSGRAGVEDATVAVAPPPPSRRERSRYPPSPSQQLSFEEEPTRED
ncbi:MAG TPA: hypothetical protein VGH21_02820 [Solirubrobacteraceae bacterium]|jgi:hypothetical protein